jgi:hypothetical protein
VIACIFLSNLRLFKSLKQARMKGKLNDSMTMHLYLTYTWLFLFVANDVLDFISYPVIQIGLRSEPKTAVLIADYIQLLAVALIEFVLALSLLYFFTIMLRVLSKRAQSAVTSTAEDDPFLKLRETCRATREEPHSSI